MPVNRGSSAHLFPVVPYVTPSPRSFFFLSFTSEPSLCISWESPCALKLMRENISLPILSPWCPWIPELQENPLSCLWAFLYGIVAFSLNGMPTLLFVGFQFGVFFYWFLSFFFFSVDWSLDLDSPSVFLNQNMFPSRLSLCAHLSVLFSQQDPDQEFCKPLKFLYSRVKKILFF